MPTLQSAQEAAEETRQLILSVFMDSERACVLLGAALIDTQLTKALCKVFRPTTADDIEDDELFGIDAPIGTFSAKIVLAARLGLIDDDFESGLNLVRKLRNKFAHASETIQLSQSPHHDRVIALRNLGQTNHVYQQVYEMLQDKKEGRFRQVFHAMSQELVCYISAVSAMLMSLKVITDDNDMATFHQLASFHVIITNE